MSAVRTLAAIGALLALPAAAHQAPAGWEYDRECCDMRDCAPAPDGAVREVQGGYRVVLPVGAHKLARVSVDAFIPHGDPRIRVSGDSERHACVSSTGYVYCVYIPPGGV
jgi:hypothetical protein